MEYELVDMKERTVVGVEARTNNFSPDMGMVIGGLWSDFFGKGIYQAINPKTDGKTLGIYTDYAGNEKDDYTVAVACEVEKSASATQELPQGTRFRTIPAGKYAKFIVKGDQKTAVGQFWQELWKMQLNRSFICDYEEYQNDDCENAEVHIYIGIC